MLAGCEVLQTDTFSFPCWNFAFVQTWRDVNGLWRVTGKNFFRVGPKLEEMQQQRFARWGLNVLLNHGNPPESHGW